MFDLIRRQRHSSDAVLISFDVIELEGEDLRGSPIEPFSTTRRPRHTDQTKPTPSTLERTAVENPALFVKVAASILPKALEVAPRTTSIERPYGGRCRSCCRVGIYR